GRQGERDARGALEGQVAVVVNVASMSTDLLYRATGCASGPGAAPRGTPRPGSLTPTGWWRYQGAGTSSPMTVAPVDCSPWSVSRPSRGSTCPPPCVPARPSAPGGRH